MLYIMRHGITDWNSRCKLQGRTDVPLNEEGRLMAIKAAEKYKDLSLDICFSSPLMRAYETAQLVLKGRNIPIITDERLVEMSFGSYEGSENSFEDENNPINVIFKNPAEYKESVGGAETFEELFKRTGEFLYDKVRPELGAGRNVLIVGHGAMNLSIIGRINKLPIEEFWSAGLKQCEIMELKAADNFWI